MDKALVAQKLANRLFATEAAVDTAMSEAMALIAAMAETRKELGLSATVGDAATAKVAEAIATLAEARSQVVAAHGELNDLKLRVGIRTKLIGIMDKPPEGEQPLLSIERRRA